MNKALKYILILILISYIITQICSVDYSFYEGYSGFINKYELIPDPEKAGSITIIDSRFDNQYDKIKSLSDKLISFNELVSIPYKAGSINLEEDYIEQEAILSQENELKEGGDGKKKYPKYRFKKVSGPYAPYETILPKEFRTENVQYVDQRENAVNTLAPQEKKAFKDQKDLEKVKERSKSGADVVTENDCEGSWSEWNIDSCGKEDNYCGIKLKTYKVTKPEISNEKGDGKPCPYKDSVKKYAYCKGNNHVERCGYQKNLCNCKLNEDDVLVMNGENHYNLLEDSKEHNVGMSLKCVEGQGNTVESIACGNLKGRIKVELAKPEPNYSKINQDFNDLKTYMSSSLDEKNKCNLSKDINCDCPEGYIFSKMDRQNICTLEKGVDCSVKYPGCIYTPPSDTGGESCKDPAFLNTPGNENQKDAFYKQYVKEQGKCIKKECVCPGGTPEDKNCPGGVYGEKPHRCKVVPCDTTGFNMKWRNDIGENICEKPEEETYDCPFGTPEVFTRDLSPGIHCKDECTTGYDHETDPNKCIAEYGANVWSGLTPWNGGSCCIPGKSVKCKTTLPDGVQIKDGAGKCGDTSTERECGSAFKCKSGYTFMPVKCAGVNGIFDDKVSCEAEKGTWEPNNQNNIELKMTGCKGGDDGHAKFNGRCIRVTCDIDNDRKKIYAIPDQQNICESNVEHCGLSNLRCKKDQYTVDDVNPVLLCRPPMNVPYNYDISKSLTENNLRNGLFYSGCEDRNMGEVIEAYTPLSLLELVLELNQRVIITGENVDNWEGYVIGRSTIKGSFPKKNINIIGEISSEITEELRVLELVQLKAKALEKGIPREDIEQVGGDEGKMRRLIVNKVLEEETAEKLQRSIERQKQRAETLESTTAELRLQAEDQANIRNEGNTINESNISSNLCSIPDKPSGIETITYQGEQTEIERTSGINPGTVASYNCEDGKTLPSGDSMRVRMCNEDGTWLEEDEEFICT